MLTQGAEQLLRTFQESFWNTFMFDYVDPFAGLVGTRNSTQLTDTYAWLSDPPMPEEWKGDSNVKNLQEYSQSLTNIFYNAAMAFSKAQRTYQQTDEIARAAARAAEKARVHRTKLLSELLETGTTAGTCYDTQAFFDTDHADVGAPYTTSQDNDKTSNITTTTAPTDLEFAAALRTNFDAMAGYRDSQGDPIMVGPHPRWIVMVPSGLNAIAQRIQSVDQITGPVGNELRDKFDVRVNQFLTNQERFYVFNPRWSRKPFHFQITNDVMMEEEEVISNGALNVYIKWTGRVGFADWRGASIHIFT